MHDSTATSSHTSQQWTVLSLIAWSTQHLTELGFDEARLHVELMLAEVLRYSRLQLYTNFDRPLTSEELAAFKSVYKRRLAHEPLQYILGHADFMGHKLLVTPAVLIPRPETEQLVELAVKWILDRTPQSVDVLDVGTGSGNIPIAISKRVLNATITSFDVSEAALEVARTNISSNQASSIKLMLADVFDPAVCTQEFDLLISNPPYISVTEHATLQPEVRDFEPRIATTDEADGLRVIRRLAEIAATGIRAGGAIFVEIAYNQAEQAANIFSGAGLRDVVIHRDYAGHPRILAASVR